MARVLVGKAGQPQAPRVVAYKAMQKRREVQEEIGFGTGLVDTNWRVTSVCESYLQSDPYIS